MITVDTIATRKWLEETFKEITDIDAPMLATYVLALLKNYKPKADLREQCVAKLDEFLGSSTSAFVDRFLNYLRKSGVSFEDQSAPQPQFPPASGSAPSALQPQTQVQMQVQAQQPKPSAGAPLSFSAPAVSHVPASAAAALAPVVQNVANASQSMAPPLLQQQPVPAPLPQQQQPYVPSNHHDPARQQERQMRFGLDQQQRSSRFQEGQTEGLQTADRGPRHDRNERVERQERPERTERMERPERSDRSDRNDRNDRLGQHEQRSYGDQGARQPQGRNLVLENVPDELNVFQTISDYFAQFGYVESVDCQPESRRAVISFGSHDEADKAWKSRSAILGDRFIKIFWQRHSDVRDNKQRRQFGQGQDQGQGFQRGQRGDRGDFNPQRQQQQQYQQQPYQQPYQSSQYGQQQQQPYFQHPAQQPFHPHGGQHADFGYQQQAAYYGNPQQQFYAQYPAYTGAEYAVGGHEFNARVHPSSRKPAALGAPSASASAPASGPSLSEIQAEIKERRARVDVLQANIKTIKAELEQSKQDGQIPRMQQLLVDLKSVQDDFRKEIEALSNLQIQAKKRSAAEISEGQPQAEEPAAAAASANPEDDGQAQEEQTGDGQRQAKFQRRGPSFPGAGAAAGVGRGIGRGRGMPMGMMNMNMMGMMGYYPPSYGYNPQAGGAATMRVDYRPKAFEMVIAPEYASTEAIQSLFAHLKPDEIRVDADARSAYVSFPSRAVAEKAAKLAAEGPLKVEKVNWVKQQSSATTQDFGATDGADVGAAGQSGEVDEQANEDAENQ
eukprot:ANDGO_06133.mRNA.1 putative RNA-binding protein C902.04